MLFDLHLQLFVNAKGSAKIKKNCYICFRVGPQYGLGTGKNASGEFRVCRRAKRKTYQSEIFCVCFRVSLDSQGHFRVCHCVFRRVNFAHAFALLCLSLYPLTFFMQNQCKSKKLKQVSNFSRWCVLSMMKWGIRECVCVFYV